MKPEVSSPRSQKPAILLHTEAVESRSLYFNRFVATFL
jgi:hypothetical protein